MQDVHLKYNSFNQLMKTKFGSKVYRITLNSGLSCPNIDGTRAKGGCYFCNDDYLLAKSWHKQQPIEDQLSYGIEYVKERHPNTHQFLAYFQNGTNTHAKADFLRPLFYKSIEPKEIVGLMISTRPDCLDNEILDLLSELNEKTYLWVELGLQSPQNHILEKINRAHTVEEFAAATEALHSRGILNCAHIILGMPDETPEEIKDEFEKKFRDNNYRDVIYEGEEAMTDGFWEFFDKNNNISGIYFNINSKGTNYDIRWINKKI
mgnify:CR=1 FL=1